MFDFDIIHVSSNKFKIGINEINLHVSVNECKKLIRNI